MWDAFWQTWHKHGEDIQRLVAVCGTIATFVLGLLAISAWRRQLRGTTRYNLSARLKITAYHFRDHIRLSRSNIAPLVYFEAPPVINDVRWHDIYARDLEREQVYLNDQMITAEALYREFKNAVHEAYAFLSPTIEQNRNLLRGIFNRWTTALQTRIALSKQCMRCQDYSELVGIDPVLAEISSSERSLTFTQDVDAAITQIESFAERYQ